MRLSLISDVHFQMTGLAAAAADSDLFICLGDLILFLDYDDPARGILADMFGAENARRFIELRTRRRHDEAREFGRQLWASVGADPRQVITERADAQYAAMFAAMPDGLFTYGNVDVPDLWAGHLRAGQQVVDGGVVTVDGVRFGFVGGGLPTPARSPFEVPEEDFAAKVAQLGPVDVLCSHIPPATPDACYDVVARSLVRGSAALYEYILEHQPGYAFHGHVHQPLVGQVTIGRTRVINVGHYRQSRSPRVIDI